MNRHEIESAAYAPSKHRPVRVRARRLNAASKFDWHRHPWGQLASA